MESELSSSGNDMTRIPNGLSENAGSLRSEVIRSGTWATVLQVSTAALRIGRTAVFANLLAPREFGVFAMGMIAVALLTILSEFGFDKVLIQKKGDIGDFIDTAWTFGVIRGLAIGLVLFLGAPLVATFFAEPAAKPILRVLSAAPVLIGLRNIRTVEFRKRLQFKRELTYRLSSEIIGSVIGIVVAIAYRNAWALVGFILGTELTMTILSFLLVKHTPKVQLSRPRLDELIKIGKWLLPSGILQFLSLEGDDAYVGRILNATSLGLYRMAFTISNSAVDIVSKSISSVAFPALSKIQSDKARLRRGFASSIMVTSGVTFPLLVGLALVSRIAIPTILGDEWSAIIVPTIILCAEAIIRANTPSAFLLSVGRTDQLLVRSFARTIVMFTLIFPLGAEFGLVGVALAVVGGRIADLLLWLHFSSLAINESAMYLVGQFLPAAAATALMASFILLELSILNLSGVGGLLFLIISGGILYLLAQLGLYRLANTGLLNHLLAR